MALPPVVAVHEIVAILGVSKARVHQLINNDEHFPDHYVRLQIGRIWMTDDIVQWAQNAGRTVNFTISLPTENRAGGVNSRSTTPRIKLIPDQVTADVVDQESRGAPTSSTGRAVKILPEEKRTAEPVGLGEQNETEGVGGGGVGEGGAVAASPRSSGQLNKIALAEDWDQLEAIYEAARNGSADLPESDLALVGFATMVMLSNATVPNYRVTKRTMVRAWQDVRDAHNPSAEELYRLATHLMKEAEVPFVSKAVKRFSDFEIAKIRKTSVKPADGDRKQPNRWQGGRNGEIEAGIARMTEEQKRRFGVKGYTK